MAQQLQDKLDQIVCTHEWSKLPHVGSTPDAYMDVWWYTGMLNNLNSCHVQNHIAAISGLLTLYKGSGA